MFRLTPVVKNLIIINAAVFIGQLFAPKVAFSCSFGPLGVYQGMDSAVTRFLVLWSYTSDCFQPYQLFTYMFTNGGFMHILFNMLSLAFIAPILETYWGPKKFLTFYLVTGIGAALFNILMTMLFGVGYFSSMSGASGAIYGVLMGFGMMFPNMEIRLLFPPIPIKAKYLVFLLGGMTFLMSSGSEGGGQVAHFAHLGGIVVAFIMIKIWRPQPGS
jgi:membrane associated rhomboid family serine protease